MGNDSKIASARSSLDREVENIPFLQKGEEAKPRSLIKRRMAQVGSTLVVIVVLFVMLHYTFARYLRATHKLTVQVPQCKCFFQTL